MDKDEKDFKDKKESEKGENCRLNKHLLNILIMTNLAGSSYHCEVTATNP
jgi:hypothetical protein